MQGILPACPWCELEATEGPSLGHLRFHATCAGASGITDAQAGKPAPPDAFLRAWSRGEPAETDAEADALHRYAALFPSRGSRDLARFASGAAGQPDVHISHVAGALIAARALRLHGRGARMLEPRAMAVLLKLAHPIAVDRMIRPPTHHEPPVAGETGVGPREGDDDSTLLTLREERAFLLAVADLCDEVTRTDTGGLGQIVNSVEHFLSKSCDALEGRMRGLGAPPMVRVHAVAEAMEDHDALRRWYLDPATGEVGFVGGAYREFLGDAEDEEEPVPEGAVWIPRLEKGEAWEECLGFAEGVADALWRDRLVRALRGPGAFRRFRDTLDEAPELRAAWRRTELGRARERVEAWVVEEGLRVELVER